MYCKNCGMEIAVGASFCGNCGAPVGHDQVNNAAIEHEDSGSIGFAIAGFFIPLVGLILFLVYEGKRPKAAKSAGKGALIGVITRVVLSVAIYVVYILFFVLLASI